MQKRSSDIKCSPGRFALYALVALVLVAGQAASQIHALSHLGHDLALARSGGKNVPPLSHTAEQCVAFHAVDSFLPSVDLALVPPRLDSPVVSRPGLSLPFTPRIPFNSRAPPVLS